MACSTKGIRYLLTQFSLPVPPTTVPGNWLRENGCHFGYKQLIVTGWDEMPVPLAAAWVRAPGNQSGEGNICYICNSCACM